MHWCQCASKKRVISASCWRNGNNLLPKIARYRYHCIDLLLLSSQTKISAAWDCGFIQRVRGNKMASSCCLGFHDIGILMLFCFALFPSPSHTSSQIVRHISCGGAGWFLSAPSQSAKSIKALNGYSISLNLIIGIGGMDKHGCTKFCFWVSSRVDHIIFPARWEWNPV